MAPETQSTFFPALNASLNALSLLFLVLGFYFIKTKRRELHMRTMWAAFGVSTAFLASYLFYHFNYESQKFSGQGFVRGFYFFILISHIILAVVILPFILRLLYLATRGAYERHAKIARWIWPLWVYTSFTGVLVYFFLYQWFPTERIAS